MFVCFSKDSYGPRHLELLLIFPIPSLGVSSAALQTTRISRAILPHQTGRRDYKVLLILVFIFVSFVMQKKIALTMILMHTLSSQLLCQNESTNVLLFSSPVYHL